MHVFYFLLFLWQSIQCGSGNVGRALLCCGQFIVKVFSAIYGQNPQSSWPNVFAHKYQFSAVIHFTCFSLNLTSHPPLHNFFIETGTNGTSPGQRVPPFFWQSWYSYRSESGLIVSSLYVFSPIHLCLGIKG